MRHAVRLSVAACLLCLIAAARADWPMAGHDPQRTSRSAESIAGTNRPIWHRRVDPYIPSASSLITVEGQDGRPDMLYVPTAAGVFALNPDDGKCLWFYGTELPVGQSPTFADGLLYVSCLDKTIHALHAATGRREWRSARAGAGFDVSPLVVGGRVYAGCRDGYFYCLDAKTGQLAWHFRTDGPITFGAAWQKYDDQPAGVVFFVGGDDHAYALTADEGKLLWKSEKLPGDGFYSFWPVVYRDRVLLSGSNSFGSGAQRLNLRQKDVFGEGAKEGALVGAVDDQGWMDGSVIVDRLRERPDRQTLLVLDRATGKQAEIPPALWWGNSSGNRYPPAIGEDGLVYFNTAWRFSHFLSGRYGAWDIRQPSRFKPLPGVQSGLESADEPEACSIIGKQLYRNDGGDGADKGGTFNLAGRGGGDWTGFGTFYPAFGPYYEKWELRKYGVPPCSCFTLHHKRSTNTLSNARPRPSILIATPAPSNRSVNN